MTGSYKVTFTKEGFEQLVRGPITLQVGFTTVNAELKVGSTTAAGEVTADIPLLQTETSDQSTMLEDKVMAQLPQVDPDWENFMILLPGATNTLSSGRGSSISRRSTATSPIATSCRMALPNAAQQPERQSCQF